MMGRHTITATAATPRSSKRLLFLSATLVLAAVFAPLSHAQETPVGNRRMGYAQLNDALYIQGGFDTETLSHLFSLDLSTSWSISSVPWTKLRNGQSTSHLALAPINAASNGGSQGSLLAIGGMGSPALPAFFSQFDISAGSWSNLTSVKSPYPHLEGHAAVSDPNTGLVYLVGGSGDNGAYNLLTVYDPKSRSMVSHQPATAANSITDAAAVWSSVRNTILTFGGTRAPPAAVKGMGGDGVLNEYDPSTNEWKTMATTGDIPPARLDHCMTASEDGSKIVVFGGSDANEYFDTIYILDVKSAKWKQGRAAPVARTRMACAFHSYQLITWGGSSGSSRSTMLANVPSVYSLNQDKWIQNYTADEKEGTSSVGGIVGGIFAVVLIGACIGFYIMRKRKRRREEEFAFHSDAMAAAAVAGEDGGGNVNALASPHAQSQYANAPIDSYGMYANGQGNDYPLSKMEVSDSHKVEATHVRYNEGYHDGVSGSTAVTAVGSGSEKAQSPGYYYGSGSVAPTPMLQSPAAAYQMHSQYSPHQGYHQADANPFTSPNNYHHYGHAEAMSPVEPDPFMRATAATATEFHSPQQTNVSASPSDPFNQYQHSPQQQYEHSPQQQYQNYTSPWPTPYQGQACPSPGARAPQMVPEYNNNGSPSGYVPPPAPL